MTFNNTINSSITKTYTVSITATTTSPTPGTGFTSVASYFTIGKMLYINYFFQQTVAGTAGTGIYLFNLPPGFTVNATPTPLYVSVLNFSNLGPVFAYTTNLSFSGCCTPYTSTQMAFLGFIINQTTQTSVTNITTISNGVFPLTTAPLTYSAYMEIPIN
jgi:hypothetical protein